jgi:hypothetical protein
MLRRSALLMLCASSVGWSPTRASAYRTSRTRLGQPDLQGLWSCSSLTRLERPSIFRSLEATEAEARNAPFLLPKDEVGNAESEWFDPGLALARVNGQPRTSWIVDPPDGRLPYSDTGRANLKATESRLDGPEMRPMNERCLSAGAGPPMTNGLYNNNWLIVQTTEHVAILMETNHEVRIIRLKDGVPGPPAWMGDSVGRWQDDVLVVETSNFHPGQSRRRGGLADMYLSPQAKVNERFRRISSTEILYSYAVEDPANYTRPWRGEMPLIASEGPLFEYACHEGNYSLPGILAGARRQEHEAAEAK